MGKFYIMKSSFNNLFLIFCVGLLSQSCANDDDQEFIEPEVTTTRSEQATIDDAILKEFMDLHTYNDLDFEQDPSLTDQDLKIVPITDLNESINSSGTPLSEHFHKEEHTLSYEDESGNWITQNLYVFPLRRDETDTPSKGKGSQVINKVSSVQMTYKEYLIYVNEGDEGENELYLSQTARDSSATIQHNTISDYTIGFNQTTTLFSGGTTYSGASQNCEIFGTNPTTGSTETNEDFGIGFCIIPSGLAYFDTTIYQNNNIDNDNDGDASDIESEDSQKYANFIYTFSIYDATDQDLDNDGIPSSEEGTNSSPALGMNNINIDTNTYTIDDLLPVDTDNDGIYDYLDTDDDNDGVLTRNEIELSDQDPNVDSDCDGVSGNDEDYQPIYPENSDTPYHLDASQEYKS